MIRNLLQTAQHTTNLRKRQGRQLPPVRPSHATELWYKVELLRIVDLLRKAAREDLLPELRRLEPLYARTADGIVVDKGPAFSPAFSTTVSSKIDEMKRRFGGIGWVAQRLAEAATRRSLKTADERLAASINSSIGIDLGGFLTRSGPIQEVSMAAMQANIRLIKSIPEQYFERISKVVTDGMAEGLRFEALASEIERIGDVTESRAKLIARDQISKMNGAFTQIRQLSLGIERYTWQTAGDERVRHEHASNDGETFRWDKAPPTGHPGEAVNCRCVAIPVIDIDEPEEGDSSERGTSGLSVAAMVAAGIGAMFASFGDDGNAAATEGGNE